MTVASWSRARTRSCWRSAAGTPTSTARSSRSARGERSARRDHYRSSCPRNAGGASVTSAHPNDSQIRALYAQFLDGWNRRSGAAVAAAFADDGDIIGYDGTHHHGRLAIDADFRQIFGTHPTAAYVAVVRSVRPVAPGVAVLLEI